jgi:hypothetical protein
MLLRIYSEQINVKISAEQIHRQIVMLSLRQYDQNIMNGLVK